MHTESTQLSKWWRTPSAQAACERAKVKRRERIERMKKQFSQRKAEQARELAQWEVRQAQ